MFPTMTGLNTSLALTIRTLKMARDFFGGLKKEAAAIVDSMSKPRSIRSGDILTDLKYPCDLAVSIEKRFFVTHANRSFDF